MHRSIDFSREFKFCFYQSLIIYIIIRKRKVETNDGIVVNRHIDQLIKKTCAEPRLEEGEGTGTIPQPGTGTIPQPEETGELDLDELFGNKDETMTQESQGSERMIEIPDADQWADMLGIPTSIVNQTTTGKIKTKPIIHTKTPYQRPHHSRDNHYMF